MTVEIYDPFSIAIEISSAAVRQIEKARQSSDQVLLLTLEKAGCSGYVYVVKWVDQALESWVCVKTNSALKLYVEKVYAPKLDGLEIDVERRSLGQQSLSFHNPQEVARCGCGESIKF